MKRMFSGWKAAGWGGLFVCIFSMSAAAGVPQALTYHGILKDGTGSFLTGSYAFTFRIYETPAGGVPLWTETHGSVAVSSGSFSAELGSVVPFGLAFDRPYWLSIEVAGDGEMSPRVKLTATGYAMTAVREETGFTESAHENLSHRGTEGVRSALAVIAKTNFKLDAYTLASANTMGEMVVDMFHDASGIEASRSSGYVWRGSPDYRVSLGGGGIDDAAVLMLAMDGGNQSTVFTDSSTTPHGVTASGDAQIATGASKFGGASAKFDASGDYLSIPSHADFNFPGNFTLDFWMRFDGVTNNNGYVAGNGWSSGWAIWWSAANLSLYVSGTKRVETSGWSPAANVWYHVAVVRSGSVLKIYINGTERGSGTYAPGVTSLNALHIGRDFSDANYMPFYLDEFRVSKGVARWTAAFTPPGAAYSLPPASATVVSVAYAEPSVPGEVLVIAEAALNAGTVRYYVSRDDGLTWTEVSSGTVTSLEGQPAGTSLRWKAVLTGNAELKAIAVAV